MKKLVHFILLLLPLIAFHSCGTNKIYVDKIKSFQFEYDESRKLYFGDTLSLNAFVINSNGEKIDLSRSNQFEVKGDNFEYDKTNGLLTINNRPTSIDINQLNIKGILTDDNNAEKIIEKTIPISFTHPVIIVFDGVSGNNSKDRANRVIGRAVLSDGKKGRNGEDGIDGENATPIEAYIWKEQEFYTVKVNYIDSTKNYFFKTKNSDLTISASGGDGGEGGDGGDGGRGKRGSESKNREPGNGGDGGNGGNGANGGDGAMITVYIHPNAEEIKSTLKLINSFGKAGQAGLAGEAGKGGRGSSGQTDGESGKNGEKGRPGQPGTDGPKPKIQLESFEIKKL